MKKAKKNKLTLQQLSRKLKPFKLPQQASTPSDGWIHTIRTALNMSLRQLADRLEITPQGVKKLEQREKDGSITLKNLREAGKALDLQLVYGFIVKESLEKMIEKKAYEIAREIVLRTSHSMMLEDQQNSKQRIGKAIKERAEEIINEMPGYLWD